MPNIQELENRANRLLYGDLPLEDLVVTDNMSVGGNLEVAGDMTSGAVEAGTLDVPNTVAQVKSIAAATTDTVVSADDNGKIFVDTKGSGATIFTLPTPTAGMNYTFICGNAGGEIKITPDSLSTIVMKDHAAQDGVALVTAAGNTIKNTAATNVAGDAITLLALNTTTWYAISQIGVWAAA